MPPRRRREDSDAAEDRNVRFRLPNPREIAQERLRDQLGPRFSQLPDDVLRHHVAPYLFGSRGLRPSANSQRFIDTVEVATNPGGSVSENARAQYLARQRTDAPPVVAEHLRDRTSARVVHDFPGFTSTVAPVRNLSRGIAESVYQLHDGTVNRSIRIRSTPEGPLPRGVSSLPDEVTVRDYSMIPTTHMDLPSAPRPSVESMLINLRQEAARRRNDASGTHRVDELLRHLDGAISDLREMNRRRL